MSSFPGLSVMGAVLLNWVRVSDCVKSISQYFFFFAIDKVVAKDMKFLD